MDVNHILNMVKEQKMSVDEAASLLKKEPFSDLGYAKLDMHRKIRAGQAEVVFCSGKTNEQLLGIFQKLFQSEKEVLGTRADSFQFEFLKENGLKVKFDPVSRILKMEEEQKDKTGKIIVCSAGTADIPVAEEAAQTAEFFGSKVERIFDIGVCGIHRLLYHLEQIQSGNCIVAVAGMEGALASVLGGLVDIPIIAVPTSVGYGANFQGLSALLTMINSCSNGIAVVNIDNGYGAGYMANQINRLAQKNVEKS